MSKVKSLLKVRIVRIVLVVVGIVLAVVVSFFLPKEPDPNIGLTNDPVTPTVGVTNLVGTLTVNRGVVYKGVTLTVTKVEEAGAFSDDRKLGGTYTVRVNVHVQPGASVQAPIGIEYASLGHLALADGQVISPKLVSLLPVVLPQQANDGFFDFPVSTQVSLSSLRLLIGSDASVAFS